jgi:predicted HTH domain antitoxin
VEGWQEFVCGAEAKKRARIGPGLKRVRAGILDDNGKRIMLQRMKIELPDNDTTRQFTPEELRLELACALYARGKLGKVSGADFAGVDFFTFQRALGERGISSLTEEMVENDVATLTRVHPKAAADTPPGVQQKLEQAAKGSFEPGDRSTIRKILSSLE